MKEMRHSTRAPFSSTTISARLMAIAGLGVALFSHWIDRRLGIPIRLAVFASDGAAGRGAGPYDVAAAPS